MPNREARFSIFTQIFSDVSLRREDLIVPLFIQEQSSKKTSTAINSMPGILKTPLSNVDEIVDNIFNMGLKSILLFGIPKERDPCGNIAYDKDGVVQRATKKLRSNFGNSINIVTDVCLCQYDTSGHCGILDDFDRGGSDNTRYHNTINNDSTLSLLSRIAASHAEAGADTVAPSAMMDGQVSSIRKHLDSCGYRKVKILSYSAKHNSSLYAPFRTAAYLENNSVIDKSSYQFSFSNPCQSLRELELDIREGADMIMIKPGLMYLDLIYRAKTTLNFPLAVQNVSGEYAMIKAAGKHGWIAEDEWKVGTIASIKRSGADRIISYFAVDIASYVH